MRFLVVAGEASGDRHGARILRAIRALRPDARFWGVGGEAMEGEGLEKLHDVSALSVMGFVEVVPQLARIVGILRDLARWAERERPDAAILLDAPDFNLRLARELGHLGIPVFYAIAPMAWAWRESRVRALRHVEALLCIYPFEEAWFGRRGVPARFVGNPLLDDPVLADLPPREVCRSALGLPAAGPILALLPGSRRAEIRGVLPPMLEAARLLFAHDPSLHFVLPVAGDHVAGEIASLVREAPVPVRLLRGETTRLLRAADAAIVCSGTATLQAALALCPQVVAYRAHPVSFFLARRLVRLSHACIVNILLGKTAVPELLQEALVPEALARAVLPLLEGAPARAAMLREYRVLRDELAGPGFGERAAAEILARLDVSGPDRKATVSHAG